MREILYRQFPQYFRNPMYLLVYVLQVASHPIALGGHYVLWRSALQERVDVVERSLNAAAHKLEPLNRNHAETKHKNIARLRDVNRLALVRHRCDGHPRYMFPDF